MLLSDRKPSTEHFSLIPNYLFSNQNYFTNLGSRLQRLWHHALLTKTSKLLFGDHDVATSLRKHLQLNRTNNNNDKTQYLQCASSAQTFTTTLKKLLAKLNNNNYKNNCQLAGDCWLLVAVCASCYLFAGASNPDVSATEAEFATLTRLQAKLVYSLT